MATLGKLGGLRPWWMAAVGVAGLLGFLAPATCAAHEPPRRVVMPPPPPPPSVSVDLEVVDAWGSPLESYWHDGRRYVLGEVGERYEVILRNHSDRRVEVVLSIDGRDALTGDLADYKKHRGYVVDPWGEVRVDGFRQTLDAVATFRFTDPGDSYSGRRGTPQHVGVIGMAVFSEKEAPRPVYRPEPWEYESRSGSGASDAAEAAPPAADDGRSRREARKAPSSPAPAGEARGASPYPSPYAEEPATQRLGTEYGESRWSPVREVTFERAHSKRPDLVTSVYYDDVDGLEARGIAVRPRYVPPPPVAEPTPFPGARFAPPPPGWR